MRTFTQVALSTLVLLAGQAAHADHNDHNNGYPTYPGTAAATCSTFSNGQHFSESDYNAGAARERVIHECRTAWNTDDYECQVNVNCYTNGSNPYPNPGLNSCTTTSRGYTFSSQSYDLGLAQNETVRQCENNPYTVNWECRQNLRCNNYGPSPGPGPYPPYPNPNPYPGNGGGYACYNSCHVGAKCSDGCPWGAQCNYVSSGQFWRVLRCNTHNHW